MMTPGAHIGRCFVLEWIVICSKDNLWRISTIGSSKAHHIPCATYSTGVLFGRGVFGPLQAPGLVAAVTPDSPASTESNPTSQPVPGPWVMLSIALNNYLNEKAAKIAQAQ